MITSKSRFSSLCVLHGADTMVKDNALKTKLRRRRENALSKPSFKRQIILILKKVASCAFFHLFPKAPLTRSFGSAGLNSIPGT